jgi:8-oxo-dGTP pyrophosphatase MutT (NUDIX family)
MTKKTLVTKIAPANFAPQVEAAGCYCECQNKLLFLKRAEGRPEPKTWCIPGGKLEKGENFLDAVVREVHEEIGVLIPRDQFEPIAKLYVRKPYSDHVFYIFRATLHDLPTIKLTEDEHEDSVWVTIDEALELQLIPGGKEALSYYCQHITRS